MVLREHRALRKDIPTWARSSGRPTGRRRPLSRHARQWPASRPLEEVNTESRVGKPPIGYTRAGGTRHRPRDTAPRIAADAFVPNVRSSSPVRPHPAEASRQGAAAPEGAVQGPARTRRPAAVRDDDARRADCESGPNEEETRPTRSCATVDCVTIQTRMDPGALICRDRRTAVRSQPEMT